MSSPRFFPVTLALWMSFVLVVLGCSENDTNTTAPEPTPVVVPDAAFIALTPTEYNNTIRDLLGMPNDPAAWPEAPPIAEQLLPKQGEKSGIFGIENVEPRLLPRVLVPPVVLGVPALPLRQVLPRPEVRVPENGVRPRHELDALLALDLGEGLASPPEALLAGLGGAKDLVGRTSYARSIVDTPAVEFCP